MNNRRGPVRALDDEEVAEMHRLRSNHGLKYRELSQRYGISMRTVSRYMRCKTERYTRIVTIVDRWARTYSLNLRQQERDALVDALCHGQDLDEAYRQRWGNRHLADAAAPG